MYIYTMGYTQNDIRYRERIIASEHKLLDYAPLPGDKMYVFYDEDGKIIRGGIMLRLENAVIEKIEPSKIVNGFYQH